MRYLKKVISVCIFAVYSMHSLGQVDLHKALPCDGTQIQRSPEQRNASLSISRVLEGQGINVGGRCLGWTNAGKGDDWFIAVEGMGILEVDVEEDSYVGNWPLAVSKAPCRSPNDCSPYWYWGRWNEDELLEEKIIGTYESGMSWETLLSEPTDLMGCMQRTPLRYGDIDGSGASELVVLLPNGPSVDFLIFSTELKKTVFASKLSFEDSVRSDSVPNYLLPTQEDQQYQFWRQSGVEADRGTAMAPALKGFAKLYVDDFDENSRFDILVWRKMFESRFLSDPTQGFHLKSELYGHYELRQGEYQLQDTEAETIKEWLAGKQLSWQQGYPSESECPGQEGELIPEMHAPLLNDPEVLQ